ncbi:WD40 repeat domain-containing protein [Nocardia asiatica]|uniref:WD40 repeat domain-containing protein n=1 Tax=Nocardia asiatica TaxID=209252 RepID=UPI0009FF1267|nr:WD40 repeat domain-containing protein [Nocardia asiatica]
MIEPTRLWRIPGTSTAPSPHTAGDSPSTTAIDLDPTIGTIWFGRIDGVLLSAAGAGPVSPGPSPITAIAARSSGLAVGTHSGQVFALPVDTTGHPGNPVRVDHHRGPISGLCWSGTDSTALISAGWDGHIRAHRRGSGSHVVHAGNTSVTAITPTSDGVAAALLDGAVLVTSAGGTFTELARLDAVPTAITTGPGGQLIVSTARHTIARITPTGTVITSSTRLQGMPLALATDHARDMLAIAAVDGTISQWSLNDLMPGTVLSLAGAPIPTLALGHGDTLYYGSRGGGITAAAISSALSHGEVPTPGGQIWSLRLSLPAGLVASAGTDSRICLRDLSTGRLRRTLTGHDGWINSVAFTTDGQLLATGSADTTVRLWNPHSGQHLRTLTGHDGWINSVAFTTDGQLLATGSADTTVRLWNPHSGQHLRTLTGHSCPVTSVAAAHTKILTTGHDTNVITWNTDGERLMTGHHRRHVWMAAIRPDGRLSATIGADNAVRIWDPLAPQQTTAFHLPDVGTACDLATLDHQRVLLGTASRDGGIELRLLISKATAS